MKYRIERHSNNHNLVTIHVDLDLLLFLPKLAETWSALKDREEDDYFMDEDAPNFVRRLLLVKGIADVVYSRYSVDLIKGDFFSWRYIIPAVIEDMETSLNRGEPAMKIIRCRAVPSKKRIETSS